MVETYRTDDMCFATVLSCAGFRYTLERLSRSKAIWIFEVPGDPDDQERFEDLCDDYDSYSHKVEPRSFLADMVKIRREMFALLDGDRPNVSAA
jgi:hypothetical protein